MHTESNVENQQATVRPSAESTQDLAATAPGQLRVIKRNGTVVPYTDDKITVAITKAFLAVEGGTAAASSRIHETVARLTDKSGWKLYLVDTFDNFVQVQPDTLSGFSVMVEPYPLKKRERPPVIPSRVNACLSANVCDPAVD